ncbi:NAD(+)--rifampin ADP-ribosyltransferase [Microbulbifer sp. GL-2]|uniref:NAD(+)--rifampin ADP-ribosyltransferase n=1 Tax=Microbulbifer sp. GL-2 TaxID=2591606 RepID=UPI001E455729|nr:NAD(+)--rifampin ADP-ribosyltransferase [Microbulbifer sp. GL-2]
MSYRSNEQVRVKSEVLEWTYYHGTRADLKIGDMLMPGGDPNFGKKALGHIYLSRTLDAAIWGAELALGNGRKRIYIVEATGPIEDDPNVTDKRFPGNPTKSFRSREPLRVIGEVNEWRGHPIEALEAMKNRIAELVKQGLGPIDD